MADANGSAIPTQTSAAEPVSDVKGKGKAIDPTPAHDSAMDMDEDDSSEESGNEEAVSLTWAGLLGICDR